MKKNMSDVIFGGISFWLFGYGLAFGNSKLSNSIIGFGDFFFEEEINIEGGWHFAHYFFQLTFATTATTIVSGALAERCKFSAYCLFSIFNTFIYCIPAHWIFDSRGWLNKLGVIDFAGAGPVHLLGGTTALIGSYILKPRINKNYETNLLVNAILGLFLLWWGWLGFNCGSSYGITETKWIYVAKAASTTLNASIGGGISSFLYCHLKNKKIYDVPIIINGILSSLVSITPCCIYVSNLFSIIIGFIGAIIGIVSNEYIKKTIIDDPVGCIGSHGISAIWGLIATGLFTKEKYNDNLLGLFYSGSPQLLLYQLLAIIVIIIWSILSSLLFFKLIDKLIGLRLEENNEILGNDLTEHGITQVGNIVEEP
jgi:Amt family ammonium transporter